jgi:hypothetical protein
MVREWALSVRALDSEQQLINFGQIIRWKSTFDVQMSHNAQAIGVTR